MRVVFDTNILVLSLLGDPATAIVQAAFAVTAGADYLVTVNIRHFPSAYRGVETILPHQFYRLLFSD